uniref:Uncharacterized protein n=1 Tax=Rhipicephalus microplus TaxID=6941 RepID=A0A6M2DAC7_RHIMP
MVMYFTLHRGTFHGAYKRLFTFRALLLIVVLGALAYLISSIASRAPQVKTYEPLVSTSTESSAERGRITRVRTIYIYDTF